MITGNYLKLRLTFIKLLSLASVHPGLVTIIQYPICTGAGAEHNLALVIRDNNQRGKLIEMA